MKLMHRVVSSPRWLVAALVAWLLFATERSAHAYLDPGSGSLIYQAALTLLLGTGLALRRFRESAARLVRRLIGRNHNAGSPGAGR